MGAKIGRKMIFGKSHQLTTLWGKNFVEIVLSHTVSDINVRKRFLTKLPADSADTLGVKKFVEFALSRTVSFGWKMVFEKSHQQIPCGSKIL